MLKQINKIIQKKIEREGFLHEVTLDIDVTVEDTSPPILKKLQIRL